MISAIDQDLSVTLSDGRTLWLTEISRQTFFEQALEPLESDSGLFVVLEDSATGSFDILAKVASVAAGHALMSLFAARCQ
jgi:hypothetical protein